MTKTIEEHNAEIRAARAAAEAAWPKHPDGRNMRLGEMTQEQQKEVWRRAGKSIQAEFSHPLVQEKLVSILKGDKIQ